MTEEEFQAKMERIYAYNRHAQAREKKLADIRSLLPAPGKILRVKEFVELIRKLHEILGEVVK